MFCSSVLAVAASVLLTPGSDDHAHCPRPLNRPRSFISDSSGRFSSSLCTTSFFMFCSNSFARLASTLDSFPARMMPRSSNSEEELLPSSSRFNCRLSERRSCYHILLHLLLDRFRTRRKRRGDFVLCKMREKSLFYGYSPWSPSPQRRDDSPNWRESRH